VKARKIDWPSQNDSSRHFDELEKSFPAPCFLKKCCQRASVQTKGLFPVPASVALSEVEHLMDEKARKYSE
jgi:hypothetical protein